MTTEKTAGPQMIQIEENLRLRRYDGYYDFALSWYQNEELVYLVDGVREPYTPEKLKRMYEFLNVYGELYFIEIREKEDNCPGRGEHDGYRPIGDVTFSQEDMPIVIGEEKYRGRGIGRKVILALAERGRAQGFPCLYVRKIYDYNIASRKCFESAGFRVYEKVEAGESFRLCFDTPERKA